MDLINTMSEEKIKSPLFTQRVVSSSQWIGQSGDVAVHSKPTMKLVGRSISRLDNLRLKNNQLLANIDSWKLALKH